MQIYFAPVSFGNGNTIADHVQWSVDGVDDRTADERSDEAQTGGVWTDQSAWIATSADTLRIELNDPAAAELHGPENYTVFGPDSFVRQPGDANEDRAVNTGDIIQVLGAGKFETGLPATWGEGDWNGAPDASFVNGPPPGDGIFDTNDIIAALGVGLFETGAYAASSTSVPEPSSLVLLLLGMTAILSVRRRLTRFALADELE